MRNRYWFNICLLAFLLLVFCSFAHAQEANQIAREAVLSPKEFIFGTIQFLCMALIVYFLMVINPAKTRDESHKEFIENLKKNDEVITSSGILGKVVAIKPEEISLEIASNVKVRINPQHIQPLPKVESKAK